jgi:serine/threonine protein kinase
LVLVGVRRKLSRVSLDFEFIGPYKIVQVLGQGGMGTVYKGVHAKTQEPAAIKVIALAMAQQSRFRRRFDAEIQTLLRLKHPNIVQLIGVGEEKGLLFYSMEYVEGENLHQLLRREKRFGWEKVLAWAIEICSALKHAHDFGIIHRDLKPANLMIRADGQIKLTDFGIAKLFGATEQTAPGSVLGTADFMAPEQAEGKSVTVRSDLYALGAICYAALAGRPPFTGSNIPEILFNVRYAEIPPLIDLAPDTPAEFCDLIHELLRRDPTQRPPTALVVGKRLQSLQAGLARHPERAPKSAVDVKHVKEMTSLDMSDHPSIEGLAKPIDPSRTQVISPKGTNPLEARPGSRGGNPSPLPTRPSDRSMAGPEEMTREGELSSLAQSEVTLHSGELGGNTNFKQVTDLDRKRSTRILTEEPEVDHWGQWLSMAGIVALLIACLAAAYWFSLPPSADALYQPIAGALALEDEEKIEGIEGTARRFLELYPEDPRVPEVRALIEEIDIQRTVRQLQRRASDSSASNLDALEQAFVDCVQGSGHGSRIRAAQAASLVGCLSRSRAVEPATTAIASGGGKDVGAV